MTAQDDETGGRGGADGSGPANDGADRVRAHVHVTGRVQGVYYRANTREQATDRGVDGWVRNLDDGRVEAVFEGPEDAVEELVAWCETGSPAADVESVESTREDPVGLEEFRIRR